MVAKLLQRRTQNCFIGKSKVRHVCVHFQPLLLPIEESAVAAADTELFHRKNEYLDTFAYRIAGLRTESRLVEPQGCHNIYYHNLTLRRNPIHFPDNHELDKRGFEKVYGTLFDLADREEQFTVLTIVQRWQSAVGGCTTGIARWMEILECGNNKVTESLEWMKSSGKLVVVSGKHSRSYNRYRIGHGVPPVKEDVGQDVDPMRDEFIIDVVDERAEQDNNIGDNSGVEAVYPVESLEEREYHPFVRYRPQNVRQGF